MDSILERNDNEMTVRIFLRYPVIAVHICSEFRSRFWLFDNGFRIWRIPFAALQSFRRSKECSTLYNTNYNDSQCVSPSPRASDEGSPCRRKERL